MRMRIGRQVNLAFARAGARAEGKLVEAGLITGAVGVPSLNGELQVVSAVTEHRASPVERLGLTVGGSVTVKLDFGWPDPQLYKIPEKDLSRAILVPQG